MNDNSSTEESTQNQTSSKESQNYPYHISGMSDEGVKRVIDKTLKDLEGKVDASDVQKAEAARDELKAAVEANDLEAMKVKRDALNEVVQNLTVKLYEQAAAAQQATGASQEGTTEQTSSNNDGVVDADFEEVD